MSVKSPHNVHMPNNESLIGSVQLVQMTVIRSVLTLMDPILVPVTVGIYWTVMEELAMVG